MNDTLIRNVLLNKLTEIEDSIGYTTQLSGPVQLDQAANGRLTRMDAMQQAAVDGARRSRLETESRKVLAALARVDMGDYGICCRCGDEIPPDRLKLDPAAPFCLDCVKDGPGQ